jgi:quercetin dioxygenase-like cupin family protein
MTILGVQVIKPETNLPAEGAKEAIIDRISNASTDTHGLGVSIVRFPLGIRRPWSTHPQDQYAWIISGSGIIASEGKEIKLVPGNLVFIPANTMHQHGASDESDMTQLSIIGGEKPRKDQICLVS